MAKLSPKPKCGVQGQQEAAKKDSKQGGRRDRREGFRSYQVLAFPKSYGFEAYFWIK